MPFKKGDQTWKLSPQIRCKTCGTYIGKKEHICRIKKEIKINCLYCRKEKIIKLADIKRERGKFCSRNCIYLWRQGKPMYINGKAEKSSAWKDKEVSYKGLHKWIGENLGKPSICQMCRKEGLSGKWIHWANISGLYLRDKHDWIRLCVKCHKKFDKKEVKDKRKKDYLEGLLHPINR